MRIRKQASKLSSSACVFPSSQSSSPSPSHASTGLQTHVCQENHPPCDAMPFLSDQLCPNRQDEEVDEKREKGILGNEIVIREPTSSVIASTQPTLRRKKKSRQESNRAVTSYSSTTIISSTTATLHKDESGFKEEERETDKKDMQIEGADDVSVTTTRCRRNDGKGWQCKREAHPQESLCYHHLTKLRSYSGKAGYCSRKKKKAVRRGRGDDGWVAEEVSTENLESDDDDQDGGDDDSGDEDYDGKHQKRKRGKKPIKARSLKSLI